MSLLPPFLNIGVGFSRYFTAVPALTDDLRRTAYRIRHDVYCRDLGFEPVRENGLETDDCDAHSAHALLRSVASGEYVGCIRLIFTRPERRDAALPFERLCAGVIDRSIADPERMPRERIAEVSRLAVLPGYRRRRGEARTPATISRRDFGTADQPRFPYIPVGLYLAMIAQARLHGIDTVFMLTEVRLANHLRRLGVDVRRIGGAIEHRGPRIPSMLGVESVVRGLNFVVRPLYEVIEREVGTAYAASREPR
jgi:N-acyl amino acid synthase of PEP-CTERM/exosortase system